MATTYATPTETVVRDPASGRLLTVRGFGALKGRLTIDDGIDLTKPIAEQVFGTRGSRKGAVVEQR